MTETAREPTRPVEVRLSRSLGLLDITMIGVGAMIGAGIFVLTGIAAGVAGPGLLVVFLLNGVVALLTAMTYAELGSAFHDAGGGYLWVKTALPDPNGFLSGWMSWFAHAVACSLYALGFGAYFRLVLEASGVPPFHLGFMTLEKWLAVLTTAVFAYINYRGASETGKAGNVVTVGKVAVIAAFIAAGLWTMTRTTDWQAAFQPLLEHGWPGVFGAMGLTFIAFEGYEIIAQTSEEVDNPKRNVPRAVFLSLLIVVPIYLLVAVVAIGGVTPPPGLTVSQYLGREKELALVHAANQFLRGGGVAILVGGLLSTLSALNATIYSSSRVAFAMARDANLPLALAGVHPRRATPHVAILLSSVIVIAMAVLLPIEDVAAATDLMFLLLFVQVNIALIRLRKMMPNLDRGFRVPLVPLVPILAIATMAWIAVFLIRDYPLAIIAVLSWLGLGTLIYYGYSRRQEAGHIARLQWMDRIERRDYSVLAALSRPETAPGLTDAALALAQVRGGEVVLMSVAEVPEGESLLAGREMARQLEPLLTHSMTASPVNGVLVRSVVKIGRRISEAIVQTAREERCNFLLLGQPIIRSFLERLVASITERVLQEAPCQVGVIYGEVNPARVRRVVVPVTGSPNSRLAAELAPAFASRWHAPLHAITVISPDLPEAEQQRLEAGARGTLEVTGFPGALVVRRGRDIAETLGRIVQSDDVVVLGAASTDPVAALLGQTVPGALAADTTCAVIVVRDLPAHLPNRFTSFFLPARQA